MGIAQNVVVFLGVGTVTPQIPSHTDTWGGAVHVSRLLNTVANPGDYI